MYGRLGEGHILKRCEILLVAIVDDPQAIHVEPLETKVFIPAVAP